MPGAVVMQPKSRSGGAYIPPSKISAVVSHRKREGWEEYLIRWSKTSSEWADDLAPYSWHSVNELSGDESGEDSALHLVQDYLEEVRKQKATKLSQRLPELKALPIIGQKRKIIDQNIDARQPSPIERLQTEAHARSPSIASATTTDSAVDISPSNQDECEDMDCYNCRLEVINGQITCHYSESDTPFNTSILPTRHMIYRASRTRSREANTRIRNLFQRKLDVASRGGNDLRLVNTCDETTPPLNFRFIHDYVYGEGVNAPDPDRQVGCTLPCRENMGGFCGCEYTKLCSCLEHAEVMEKGLEPNMLAELHLRRQGQGNPGFFDKNDNGWGTMGFPKKFPYQKGTGHLVASYLKSRYPIYECNEKCNCGSGCKSRVVQFGRTVGLEIFKTKDRGWGLRATEDLAAGQFIDCYTGEVITSEAADIRLQAVTDKSKASYFFDLDKFSEQCERDYGHDFLYTVDGEHMGSVMRFLNHSCAPNCRQYVVSVDKNDCFIYKLAFFAVRYIQKGEELTFDYHDEDDPEVAEKLTQEDGDDDSVPCRCGAKNCRKWLWK